MSSRELARVLIKVMGLVVLVVVVIHAVQLIAMFIEISRSDSAFGSAFFWPTFLALVLWALIAVLLLRQADWIAERLRMGSDDPSRAFADGARVTEAGLTAAGAKLVGIYAFLRAIEPISHLVYGLLPDGARDSENYARWGPMRSDPLQLMIEAGLYLVTGIVLFIGAGRIGRWVRHTFTATKPTDATPPSV